MYLPHPVFPPCQRVPLSRQLLHTSYAWPTHSALSSMILPQLSITFLSPTRSRCQIYLLDGTLASVSRPAQHSLVKKGTGLAFMSPLSMAPLFQSSGGVCSSAFLYCACRLNPAFAGNAIELSGLVTGNITYDLQLDGLTNSTVSPSSGTTLLAAYDNLQPTNHTLSLIVHNPANSSYALIAIDHALIKVNSTSPKCVPRCLICALRVRRILILLVQRHFLHHHC